jgi:hypothetical protein
MANPVSHAGARNNVFKATLTRFTTNRRSRQNSRGGNWRRKLLHPFTPGGPASALDPVSLAVFAIDRVGPAAVRACASGVEVRVAVPDEATAAVLRAALTETARRRATDQLIRIVVD